MDNEGAIFEITVDSDVINYKNDKGISIFDHLRHVAYFEYLKAIKDYNGKHTLKLTVEIIKSE